MLHSTAATKQKWSGSRVAHRINRSLSICSLRPNRRASRPTNVAAVHSGRNNTRGAGCDCIEVQRTQRATSGPHSSRHGRVARPRFTMGRIVSCGVRKTRSCCGLTYHAGKDIDAWCDCPSGILVYAPEVQPSRPATATTDHQDDPFPAYRKCSSRSERHGSQFLQCAWSRPSDADLGHLRDGP